MVSCDMRHSTANDTSDSAESPSQEDIIQKGDAYRAEKHGVWDILYMDEGYQIQFTRLFGDLPKSLPYLYQLVLHIYALSPSLFALFCISQLWANCQGAVNLHFSSQLLQAIEVQLKDGTLSRDYMHVLFSLATRLVALALAGGVSWYNERLLSRLRRRIISYFEIRIMKGKLNHDLAQAGSAANQINITSSQAWCAFEEIFCFVGWGIDALSQFTLIFHLSRETGGWILVALCIIKPLVSTSFRRSIWDKVSLMTQSNKEYLRMEALKGLTQRQYQQDVISGNLHEYIVSEYQVASNAMGDLTDEDPWILFERHRTPWPQMVLNLLGDLPTVYCVLLAITSPKSVSFSHIAILQESVTSMERSMQILFQGIDRFRQSLHQIKELGEVESGTTQQSQDSQVSFNSNVDERDIALDKLDATLERRGMGFELKNVFFAYPGGQTNTHALQDINLAIKPGQFVVLVGANGSGKSTLVKLLAKLYDTASDMSSNSPLLDEDNDYDDDFCDDEYPQEPPITTGELLINGLPVSSYSAGFLRRSMAVLGQDNYIYPGFSLGENIGLGHALLAHDDKAVLDAAGKTGADKILKHMKDGKDTILDPMIIQHHFNVKEQDKTHPLKKLLEKLRRPVEVSGGERQKLVAARTFMRFKSGNIRFLAVDEPTSALDAESEATLLENLLKERDGKTMVFVTHRFGKLTKQADLILCMKDGKIAEMGTHKELMLLAGGEYRKLYDIQASAFNEEGIHTEE